MTAVPLPASAPTGVAAVQAILTQVARRVVGQDAMVERLMIGLLTGGHVLLEGVPGLAKTLTVRTLAETIHTTFRPHSVHTGSAAGGCHRHPDLRSGVGRISHQARPDLRQHRTRRRDQSCAGQSAGGAARSDAGATGDDRRNDLSARRTVSGAGDAGIRSSRKARIRCRKRRSIVSC